MELINLKDLFNDEFNLYIASDHSDYINKLFKFASKYPELETTIINREEIIKNAIAEEVLNNDYSDNDYDMYGHTRDDICVVLNNISNYLYSLKPYDALDILLNGDINELIKISNDYSKKMQMEIRDKISYVKRKNDIEIKCYKLFKNCLDDICYYLEDESYFTLLYETMHINLTGMEDEMLLSDLNDFVTGLVSEADIISKFDNQARVYVAAKLNNAWSNMKTERVFNFSINICRSLLLNYVLLSLYSDTPEKIKISDNTLKSILLEVKNGTITKDDAIDAIYNGPIKFGETDIEYINNYFINKLFPDEKKKILVKDDLLDIVK